jgi:hypothetical protein
MSSSHVSKARMALLLIAGFVAGNTFAGSESSPDVWGPYVCTNCWLGTPVMDPNTRAFIDARESENYPGVGQFIYKDTGDKYIVCNYSNCVTYVRTDSGHFLGGEATPREAHTGGGEFGGIGGGGGGAPGSGCITIGGGTGRACTSVGEGEKFCETVKLPEQLVCF